MAVAPHIQEERTRCVGLTQSGFVRVGGCAVTILYCMTFGQRQRFAHRFLSFVWGRWYPVLTLHEVDLINMCCISLDGNKSASREGSFLVAQRRRGTGQAYMQPTSWMWRECRLLNPSRDYAAGPYVSLYKKLLLALRASEIVKSNLKVSYREAVQRIISEDWEPVDGLPSDLLPNFPDHQCGPRPYSIHFLSPPLPFTS